MVGVEGGAAHQRQHVAGARVKSHQGALVPFHHFLGGLLDIVVDGQPDGLARDGLLPIQFLDLFAAAIHNHAPLAVLAHQDVVVEVFQAGLAHAVAQRIAARGNLLAGGFAHVAEQVCAQGVFRIAARIDHDQLQLRQVVAVGFHEGDVGQLGHVFEHNRLVERRVGMLCQPVLQPRALQVEATGDLVERVADFRHVLAQYDNAEGGVVVHQRPAIPVIDDSARGHHGQGANPVALGQIGVVVRPHHLQLPEAHQQQHHNRNRSIAQQRHARGGEFRLCVQVHSCFRPT